MALPSGHRSLTYDRTQHAAFRVLSLAELCPLCQHLREGGGCVKARPPEPPAGAILASEQSAALQWSQASSLGASGAPGGLKRVESAITAAVGPVYPGIAAISPLEPDKRDHSL